MAFLVLILPLGGIPISVLEFTFPLAGVHQLWTNCIVFGNALAFVKIENFAYIYKSKELACL